MRRRHFVAIALSVVMLATVFVGVESANALTIGKLISKASADISISKGSVAIKVTASAVKGTKKMTGKMTLQKKDGLKWVNVKTWTKTSTGTTLTMTAKGKVPVTGIKKKAYRVQGIVKATKGKATDTKTVYSKIVYSW